MGSTAVGFVCAAPGDHAAGRLGQGGRRPDAQGRPITVAVGGPPL